jgi:hypothetical protein
VYSVSVDTKSKDLVIHLSSCGNVKRRGAETENVFWVDCETREIADRLMDLLLQVPRYHLVQPERWRYCGSCLKSFN